MLFLLEHGADGNAVDRDGATALILVIQYHSDNIDRCIKLITSLIKHGADIRQTNKLGVTPLMTAVQKATHTDIVQLVLRHEDNVNSIDDNGLSACRYCFQVSNYMACKAALNNFQMLVESGANIVSNGVKLPL
ncbi:hypothetical protein SNE40_006004 [Patella caerulea]|uniref:Uncharacterized protein n=1 Tax=Patella caerulea TaxID=87958 RepID=A0AAN8K8Q4_PATCE